MRFAGLSLRPAPGACTRDHECPAGVVGPALEGANDLGVCIPALICSVAIRVDAATSSFGGGANVLGSEVSGSGPTRIVL